MRRLKQGDTVSPMAPLGNNFRPPQPLHQRAIRTNIDLIHSDRQDRSRSRVSANSDDADTVENFSANNNCPSMEAKKFYQGELGESVRKLIILFMNYIKTDISFFVSFSVP